MADKNERWRYAGMAAVVVFLLMCFVGQPQQYLSEKGILECKGCETPANGGPCWDGSCYSALALDILDKCCLAVPTPTCAWNDATGYCEGTCPVPDSWVGWTGDCQYVIGGLCKCAYYPPGQSPPV